MRRAVVMLSIISTAVLINACSPAVAPAKGYVECPASSRPDLPRLDPSLHIGHPVNIERLMTIVDRLSAHVARQDAALACAAAQLEGL